MSPDLKSYGGEAHRVAQKLGEFLRFTPAVASRDARHEGASGCSSLPSSPVPSEEELYQRIEEVLRRRGLIEEAQPVDAPLGK
jgi:hypothetical protein